MVLLIVTVVQKTFCSLDYKKCSLCELYTDSTEGFWVSVLEQDGTLVVTLFPGILLLKYFMHLLFCPFVFHGLVTALCIGNYYYYVI
jgi:hypothetical protein